LIRTILTDEQWGVKTTDGLERYSLEAEAVGCRVNPPTARCSRPHPPRYPLCLRYQVLSGLRPGALALDANIGAFEPIKCQPSLAADIR
jgi:hypothetical protein